MNHTANKEGTLREQAAYWLEKAVSFESDPAKDEKFVSMAFNKALKWAIEAIAAERSAA